MPCTKVQEIDVAAFAAEPRAAVWAEFRNHYPRCAECSREVARFATLTTALASEGASASAHLSESQILRLATNSSHFPPGERVRLEAHLAGCAPCRTELAVARRFDFAAVSAAPGRLLRLGRLRGAFAPVLRRPALAAAAVVVLAVSVGVLVSRYTQETRAPVAEVAETSPPVTPEPSAELATREETPAPVAPVARAEPAPVAVLPSKPEVAEASEPEPPRPIEIAALLPTDSPLYAPGAFANGPSVRVGGEGRSLGARSPTPEALGPAHVGVTSHESPNLYWFLPEATLSAVEVTIIRPGVADPLLETTLPGPFEAGVHRVSLSERGVRLEPDLDYRWFVALVRDPERRSQDAVSGAAARYTPAGLDPARLTAASPARAAHVYAESGFWYDAFDQLSSWIAAEQGVPLLRSHRAALLEQVGLDDAAAFERGSAAGDR